MMALGFLIEMLYGSLVVLSQKLMDGRLLWLRFLVISWTVGQGCVSSVDHPCVVCHM